MNRLLLLGEFLESMVKCTDPQLAIASLGDLLRELVPSERRLLECGEMREGEAELLDVRDGNTLLVSNGENGWRVTAALRREAGPPFSEEELGLVKIGVGQLALWARLSSQLVDSQKALGVVQRQLTQSAKMASLGQLAGGVAHELNTPLGAISLAVEGALTTLTSRPERSELRLRRAMTSVQQMKEIVAKLLSFSRDTRGERRPVDLNGVIQDSVALVAHQLRLDNVQISTELSTLPPVLANKNELQQVFTNLCLNARDAIVASQSAQRTVLISTSVHHDEVKATVRDWGCGVEPEAQDRVFEAFYTTKEEGKGTGLGLSVSAHLIEQHGGQIYLERPGQGSEFVVILPRLHEEVG